MNGIRPDDGVPGSLSEGAGSPQGLTEGVSFDGCFGLIVYSQTLFGSEIFECLRSSDDTPSVSHSLDSSLREGAGNGCVPFNVPLGNRNVAGDFHRPYEGRFPFIGGHSLSLAFARQLPQRGSRERVRGRVPFNRVLAKPEGCGRFSSPLRNSEWFTFHHSTSRPETVGVRAIFIAPTKGGFHSLGCSESGRGCTVQWRLSQSGCKKVYKFIVAWEF